MPKVVAEQASPGEDSAEPGAPGESKLAARIARMIEDDVIAAGWPVGLLLGSENDLIERYGVSRAVFREAIRLVEHHQVAVMRRGRSGGLRVIAPSAEAAVGAAVVYLEYTATTVDDLMKVRSLLEPQAAAEAAKHLAESDIQTLRTAAEEQPPEMAEGQVPAGFANLHDTLAELTGNPALQLFVEVLTQLTDRYAKIRRSSKADRIETSHEVNHAHRAIADAVVAGDAATAQHYMSVHLRALHAWFADSDRRIVTRRPLSAGDRTVKGRKLAEVIAEDIRADIVRGRWEVGEVVDSENGLVERYDVSRAAIREAVRLLEHHSIARMRRGPGGGLIVAKPDLDASAEAMALYLDYRGTSAGDLLLVRKILELGCVDLVTARAGEPEVRDRLRRALAVVPDTPAAEVNRLADQLHLTVAELTGNPALVFLMRMNTILWARHVRREPEQRSQNSTEVVIHAHEAIVEAMLGGDRELARHRMTRHLDALSVWWH
jgi:DNA-binding FadR family transcriptional regulator